MLDNIYTRCILTSLPDNFKKMSTQANDLVFENLTDWLYDHGRSAKDVMQDDEGHYILVENEIGFEKVYLPELFNTLV